MSIKSNLDALRYDKWAIINEMDYGLIETKEEKLAHKERTDTCAVPAASVVAESMLCFVLADAMLEKFGGDTMDQLKAHIKVSGNY